MKRFKGKFTCYIGLILYRLTLDYSYVNIISPTYEYQGFYLVYDKYHYILSWIIMLIFSPLIVKTFLKSNISSNIMSVLVLISLIPTLSLFAFNEYNLEYLYLNVIYWALLLFLNLIFKRIKFKSNFRNQSDIKSKLIILILSGTILYISGKYVGFRIHFGIWDVYALRLEAREFNMFVLLNYLQAAANTILPITFVYLLIKKHTINAIIVAFIIFLNFSIAGSKSVLLLLFIALIGYFFIHKIKNMILLLWGFISLILITIVENSIFKTWILSFFITFRTLFLPSQINTVYYKFFSIREKDFFRQGLLKWTGWKSPYKEDIPFLMGTFDGGVGGRANNGLFSDAYSNLGLWGMIFFPFFIIYLLKFIEGSVEGLDNRLYFIIIVATTVNLLSLTLSTALFSGGLFLLIIFLYTIPKNKI